MMTGNDLAVSILLSLSFSKKKKKEGAVCA